MDRDLDRILGAARMGGNCDDPEDRPPPLAGPFRLGVVDAVLIVCGLSLCAIAIVAVLRWMGLA